MYSEKTLREYIEEMIIACHKLGGKFQLSINRSFIENWSTVTFEDEDGEIYYDDDKEDKFYKIQQKYLEENNLDYDILALSFIKSGEFDDYANNDT